jgi:hypothetical protein
MPCLERAADRRREQHRHALGLPLVPCRDQAAGVFEDLRLGRAPGCRFRLGGCGALRLHLALVESHGRIVIGFLAAIEAGESSLRDAAEGLALAQKDFNATQREVAEAVGRSASWVNRLLKWRRSGYTEYSPFGPTTKAGRVAHAQQRTKASKPRKPKATTATSADAETSSSCADAETSTSGKPSPAEARGNLMYAISHWWPHMDHAGKVEVTAFFFKQKGVPMSGANDRHRATRDLLPRNGRRDESV